MTIDGTEGVSVADGKGGSGEGAVGDGRTSGDLWGFRVHKGVCDEISSSDGIHNGVFDKLPRERRDGSRDEKCVDVPVSATDEDSTCLSVSAYEGISGWLGTDGSLVPSHP